MDAVLIDAPCTGSGIWRRRPDAKWRLSERALAERVADQSALLDSCRCAWSSRAGRIVYVTCSLLPEENAERIAAFVARFPAFAPLPGADVIASSDLADGAKARLAEAALLLPEGVVLTPRRTGTDGFFIAVLKRKK